MLYERNPTQMTIYCMLPVIWNSRKSKTLILESWSVVDRGWEKAFDHKQRTWEDVRKGDGNVLYHDGGSVYAIVYICQNSWTYTL